MLNVKARACERPVIVPRAESHVFPCFSVVSVPWRHGGICMWPLSGISQLKLTTSESTSGCECRSPAKPVVLPEAENLLQKFLAASRMTYALSVSSLCNLFHAGMRRSQHCADLLTSRGLCSAWNAGSSACALKLPDCASFSCNVLVASYVSLVVKIVR